MKEPTLQAMNCNKIICNTYYFQFFRIKMVDTVQSLTMGSIYDMAQSNKTGIDTP